VRKTVEEEPLAVKECTAECEATCGNNGNVDNNVYASVFSPFVDNTALNKFVYAYAPIVPLDNTVLSSDCYSIVYILSLYTIKSLLCMVAVLMYLYSYNVVLPVRCGIG